MDPVCSDDRVGGHLGLPTRSARQRELRLSLVLAHRGTASVQANHFFGERSLKHRQKIGPVGDVAMGSIETLAFLAHRLNEEDPTVCPAAELPRSFQSNCEIRQLV